jgi:hypothetical protein
VPFGETEERHSSFCKKAALRQPKMWVSTDGTGTFTGDPAIRWGRAWRSRLAKPHNDDKT